jgi:hypothetical protein
MQPEVYRPYWERRARTLAWWINVGAWLEHFAPVFFAIATPAAVAIYAFRRQDGVPPPLLYSLGLVAALAGVIALWRARAGFFQAAEARVLLESGLRLDNRLTAATEGVSHWPDTKARPGSVLRWRLEVPAGWLAGAVALLGLSVLAPIGDTSALPAFAGPPPSLTQTQEMIGALKALQVASPDSLEKLAERAAELARRPADSQFDHAALEAADALRDQIAAAAAALGRDFESAASAIQAAAEGADLKATAERLATALQGLRDGALPANRDLLAMIPANLAELAGLTPQQLAELAERLGNAGSRSRGIAGARGNGRGGFGDALPSWLAGRGIGSGGPGGGGEAAPLTLKIPSATEAGGGPEGLSIGDLSRASLGDKLSTSAGAHDKDPEKLTGPTAAGNVAAPAQGGDAVWVNRLTPAERAALKGFFK